MGCGRIFRIRSLTKNYLWIRTLTRPTGCQSCLEKSEGAFRAALASNANRANPSAESGSQSAGTSTSTGGSSGPASSNLVSARTKDFHSAVETFTDGVIQQTGNVSMENAKDKVFA